MSSIRKSSTRRSDDTMDDDSDDKDSKRKSRNLSEKKRRDQFNLLVNELSTMVATGSRKMDKSTVLKSTIAFLKSHNEIAVRSRINEIREDWKPPFLTNEEFTHLILEAVDGFIMVFSSTGQIFHASESITSLLGHLPNDVLKMTIYDMVCSEEHGNLYNILLSPSEEEGHVSFSCHLKRGDPDAQETASFEYVHFVGYFRTDENMTAGETRYTGYSEDPDPKVVFVGTGKIQTPRLIREMPLLDSNKSEFTSRHSLEWKFLFLDHRAPPIIGYLPFELLGTSGYDYYHIDDLDNVINCHEALMQKGEGTSCYYRFLTKGQQWIWLQTRFYITYHQWNSKPEFIVCTHKAVSYVDVIKQHRKEDTHFAEQSQVVGNGASNSQPWTSKSSKGSYHCHGAPSDCTSMSADSPASRHSAMTQHSTKSRSNLDSTSMTQATPPHQQSVVSHQQPPSQQQQQPQQQSQQQQSQQQQQQQQPTPANPSTIPQFIDPSQYVAAIPMQPSMISNFPSFAVLSPLQNVDQVQLDLQRKHAELQAIIGQQQAELRRVSEQLLMAKLGLLAQPQNQSVTNIPSYAQGPSSATVSSTTTGIHGIQSNPVGESALVDPVSISLSISQQQQNVACNPSTISNLSPSRDRHL